MITIIDYGLGNLKALTNVYKRLNIDFQLASNIDQLKKASKIILPGVGAFDNAMTKLNDSGLRNCLDDLVLDQKIPVIGICVGMQMMANSSEEGILPGLGWINGVVKHLSKTDIDCVQNLPLPHMGWNNIKVEKESNLIINFDEYKNFYFLHSYYFQCQNYEDVIANSHYGFDFPCIVNNNNIYGIQCHPEKSHYNGITLLKNFAELS
jgi:glutamine amidotransferase